MIHIAVTKLLGLESVQKRNFVSSLQGNGNSLELSFQGFEGDLRYSYIIVIIIIVIIIIIIIIIIVAETFVYNYYHFFHL